MNKLRRPSHATVVAYVALIITVGGGTAYAATGGLAKIGRTNYETSGTAFQRSNPGSALRLAVRHGSAPLSVNSSTLVGNLNADRLDGKHGSSYQPKIASRLTFTPLTLQNGWTGNCYSTGQPAVALDVSGVVHLRGGICSGSGLIFTLPSKFRPSNIVYLTTDQYGAETGRIYIYPNGDTYVQDDPDHAGSGSNFTSLAGVSYSLPY